MYFKGLNKRLGNTNLSHTFLHILHTVQYNFREELLNKYYNQSQSIFRGKGIVVSKYCFYIYKM